MDKRRFFVCEPIIFDYIKDDQTIWERDPIEQNVAKGAMAAFKHYGYWKPMDTLRDKQELEQELITGSAPCKEKCTK